MSPSSLSLLVAFLAAVALVAHALGFWQVLALYRAVDGGLAVGLATLGPGAAPFFVLLTGLVVAAGLRWSRLFPWAALATPWLLFEGLRSFGSAVQPGLGGGLAAVSAAAGLADLLAAGALVVGSVLHWKR